MKQDSNNKNMETTIKTDTAVFATGCFWCTEAIFSELKGVISVMPGFAGGTIENPTYEQVCTGTTGHAECCRIIYSPDTITYDKLLEVFWKVHDPTSLNRQGEDVGTQYRSAIFYNIEKQQELAEKYKKELNGSGAFDKQIVTEIVPLKEFWPSEDYHQNYYNLNKSKPYCQVVIRPKLEKFEKIFKDALK
jgi:peptide-methionine (S)-S-oxide reductase